MHLPVLLGVPCALLPQQPMALPPVQVLEQLLVEGAAVEICSKHEGLTALHLAAVFGHTDVALALVEHGACTAMHDGDHLTAAEVASVFGQDACADALAHDASLKSPAAEVSIHQHCRVGM